MSQVVISIQDTPYENQFLFGANLPTTLTQIFTAATYASVTVPSGAIGVYIIPQNNNTGTITMKGVTADTGINIPKTQQSFFGFDSASASFGLLCASSISITFIFV